MLNSVPKDVLLIVYRYVHESHYHNVKLEYYTLFKPYWHDNWNAFGCSYDGNDVVGILLMYRELGYYLYHYQDPNLKEIYEDILNLYTGKKTGTVSHNYVHARLF